MTKQKNERDLVKKMNDLGRKLRDQKRPDFIIVIPDVLKRKKGMR